MGQRERFKQAMGRLAEARLELERAKHEAARHAPERRFSDLLAVLNEVAQSAFAMPSYKGYAGIASENLRATLAEMTALVDDAIAARGEK